MRIRIKSYLCSESSVDWKESESGRRCCSDFCLKVKNWRVGCVSNRIVVVLRAVLAKSTAGKFPQDFTAIGIIPRSRANIVPGVPPNQPKKHRYPIPIQIVRVEILISHSYPNDSRGNVCFPVVFRSPAVKSRRTIDSPNPVHTKTVNKKHFPLE